MRRRRDVPHPTRSLGYGIVRWCQEYLLQPDGVNAGEPWKFSPEQLKFLLWLYAIDDRGKWLYDPACLRRAKGWLGVIRRRTTDVADAEIWINETFGHYPGAIMATATTDEGCLTGLRDGRRIHANSPNSALTAATIYTCVRADAPAQGPIPVRTGRLTRTIQLHER